MLKSILAATVLTAVLASGAMAAAPTTKLPVLAKHPTVLVHNTTLKKMLHHCKKHLHFVKDKCVAYKM